MIVQLKKTLSKLAYGIACPARFVRAVVGGVKQANKPSYYPEIPRKGRMARVWDNICWAAKYLERNDFYCLYGLDIIGSNPSNYMDYRAFYYSRNESNRVGKANSQIALLRDKYLFFRYMRDFCYPVPDVFALYKKGKLYNERLEPISDQELKTETEYFVKSIDGECADFVKHVVDYEAFQKIKGEFDPAGMYLFQRRVYQADSMNAINPGCINTYRIVTVNKNGDPYVFTAGLRVGTKKSGNVDNWAAGGLFIGIDDDGKLCKYGFYKPQYGLKTEVHPDTGVRFEGLPAPDYDRAVQLALEAHKKFYNIRSIGWDIAITEEGPCFIEGNDNWEISLMQAGRGPMRKKWEEVIVD